MDTERTLRAAYSEWPRSSPIELLQALRALELEMAKHLRTPPRWGEVEQIVRRGFDSLRSQFPEQSALVDAKKEEWLAEAYEGTGRLKEAIASLEFRLRRRRPRPVSRENCYARLVDLLVREGRIGEAKSYVSRGYRYTKGRDPIAAEFIRRVGVGIGVAVE